MATYPTVEPHHKLAYSNNVMMVSQQLRNPLMGAVTEMPASGDAQSVADLIGQIEYTYAEDRSRRNPENYASATRRWVVRPQEIESGQYIDKVDQFDMMMNPTSIYVRNHTTAVIRGWADRILGIRKQADGSFAVADGGILGVATEGKRGTQTVALPNSQFIAHASAGLTLDKLRAVKVAMQKVDFGLEDDDPIYCAITPTQADDLLDVAAKADTSIPAFAIEQLRSGKPTTLMGFNWIVTNRLPKVGANRLCPVWTKRNVMVGVWQGIVGAAWNDTSAKNKPYVHVGCYIDAVRVEDKGVYVIECAEA